MTNFNLTKWNSFKMIILPPELIVFQCQVRIKTSLKQQKNQIPN